MLLILPPKVYAEYGWAHWHARVKSPSLARHLIRISKSQPKATMTKKRLSMFAAPCRINILHPLFIIPANILYS